MRNPQELLLLHKVSDKSKFRWVSANYDEHGFLKDITNIFGEVFILEKDNTLMIYGGNWVLHDHLNRVYRDEDD